MSSPNINHSIAEITPIVAIQHLGELIVGNTVGTVGRIIGAGNPNALGHGYPTSEHLGQLVASMTVSRLSLINRK